MRAWLLPFVGPRALFLAEHASPLWAFEIDFGARVGVISGDAI